MQRFPIIQVCDVQEQQLAIATAVLADKEYLYLHRFTMLLFSPCFLLTTTNQYRNGCSINNCDICTNYSVYMDNLIIHNTAFWNSFTQLKYVTLYNKKMVHRSTEFTTAISFYEQSSWTAKKPSTSLSISKHHNNQSSAATGAKLALFSLGISLLRRL